MNTKSESILDLMSDGIGVSVDAEIWGNENLLKFIESAEKHDITLVIRNVYPKFKNNEEVKSLIRAGKRSPRGDIVIQI